MRTTKLVRISKASADKVFKISAMTGTPASDYITGAIETWYHAKGEQLARNAETL
jgi:hypothetical protein